MLFLLITILIISIIVIIIITMIIVNIMFVKVPITQSLPAPAAGEGAGGSKGRAGKETTEAHI